MINSSLNVFRDIFQILSFSQFIDFFRISPMVFQKVLDFLNERSIDFQVRHHEPTPTSEDSARVRGELLSSGAKAIVYKVQDEFCLFVFAADQKMDTKKIKVYFKSQGRRAKKTRFATIEELDSLTGLIPGSVPPFGRPILPFELFVDPSLLQNEKISFNAGSLEDSVTMGLEDYMKISDAKVFEFT